MAEAPRVRDWLWALLRLRALWVLPALLLLALVLLWAPDEVWRSPTSRRRTFSRAELAMVFSGLGTLLYWLVLALSRAGLLQQRSARWPSLREPSEAELKITEAGTRLLCLLLAYAGPLFLLLAK